MYGLNCQWDGSHSRTNSKSAQVNQDNYFRDELRMSHTSSTLPQFLSPIVLQVHEQDAAKTGGPGDAAFTDNI